ncbi:MAG: M23 family metallopeptidase [Pseudomonadota bacterium]|uniref:M23 family metallopeptidase n=1 Tax=Phenylobacterium sp. TaxID=1871053 RepID=UPI0025D2E8DC|nr:M23 family metallopeptidase [Phenylobacterium sp.]MBT9471759.1 M23 family metallopeptidase [Phenylobacterium sp.]
MKFAPLVLAGLIAGCAPADDSSAQASKAAAPPTSDQASASAGAGLALAFPVDCQIGKTCEVQNYMDRDPGPGAKDYRCGTHTYEGHGGVDIRLLDMAAQKAGVNVLAAAPGRVSRLRDGVADISVKTAGSAAVSGQECGNGVVIDHGGGWETQYCHLASGSVAVKVGETVRAGRPIARIGLSGNTEYPHLHITTRKAGTTVDAFAPNLAAGTCAAGGAGDGLWRPDAASAMAYKPGAVLNAGFAAGPVTMETIEAGGIAPPTTASTALVAYVRAINLQGGDVQELVVTAPDGSVVAQASQPALDRAKAQYMMFTGKRASTLPWKPGDYIATYTVRRDGGPALTRVFKLRL